jgi:hypothetical protein
MSAAPSRHSSAGCNLLAFLLLAGCAPSAQPVDHVGLYPASQVLLPPPDVEEFIVRWEACAHWLGEPPWDDARRAQIERAVRETCPGIDEQGRRVRAAHAGYPELLAALRDYEPLGH